MEFLSKLSLFELDSEAALARRSYVDIHTRILDFEESSQIKLKNLQLFNSFPIVKLLEYPSKQLQLLNLKVGKTKDENVLMFLGMVLKSFGRLILVIVGRSVNLSL